MATRISSRRTERTVTAHLEHCPRGRGAVETGAGEWRLFACGGDEALYCEHRMSFSEWLYRYLVGEDMFDRGSGVFHPGAIVFKSMPKSETDIMASREGPDRGR